MLTRAALSLIAAPLAVLQIGGVAALTRDLAPIDYASVLVDLGIPNGIEVRLGTDVPRQRQEAVATAVPNIDEVATLFNSWHTEERAEIDGRVLVIRPSVNRALTLDREIELPAEVAVDDDTAFRKVLHALDSNVPAPAFNAPTVGSRLLPMTASGKLYPSEALGPISIGARRMTLRAALNSIVSQVPNHGWAAVTQLRDGQVRIVEMRLVRKQQWILSLPFQDAGAP